MTPTEHAQKLKRELEAAVASALKQHSRTDLMVLLPESMIVEAMKAAMAEAYDQAFEDGRQTGEEYERIATLQAIGHGEHVRWFREHEAEVLGDA